MTPSRSPSAMTSMAYNARTRLGFQILIYLFENGLIEEKKIPDDVITMIRVWANMKKGRRHHFQDTITGQLLELLYQVPASDSPEICGKDVTAHIKSRGELLLIDGYIVIYPTGDGNNWSYRRTLTGDHLLKITHYS